MECHICGTTEELEVYGEFHLCPECRDEHLRQCSDCGEHFIDNENDYVINREGDIYCESCRDELSYCEHCEEYSDCNDFVHIVDLDEYWCVSCAEIMLIIAIHAGTGLRKITVIRILHFAGDVSSRIITSATIAGN